MGEPEDVAGECNARLFIADNYGDNHATMRCQRHPEHLGNHVEEFDRGGHPARIEWEQDERATTCAYCEKPLPAPAPASAWACDECAAKNEKEHSE